MLDGSEGYPRITLRPWGGGSGPAASLKVRVYLYCHPCAHHVSGFVASTSPHHTRGHAAKGKGFVRQACAAGAGLIGWGILSQIPRHRRRVDTGHPRGLYPPAFHGPRGTAPPGFGERWESATPRRFASQAGVQMMADGQFRRAGDLGKDRMWFVNSCKQVPILSRVDLSTNYFFSIYLKKQN